MNDYKIGDRNGKLAILGEFQYMQSNPKARLYLYCRVRCDCGIEKFIRCSSLKRIVSCGCIHKHASKYGDYRTREDATGLYKRYAGIKTRCYNSYSREYHRYGGRGITMCEEWKNDFLVFREWALTNGFKRELQINRINNDGNYCPENCCWVTHRENQQGKTYNTYY